MLPNKPSPMTIDPLLLSRIWLSNNGGFTIILPTLLIQETFSNSQLENQLQPKSLVTKAPLPFLLLPKVVISENPIIQTTSVLKRPLKSTILKGWTTWKDVRWLLRTKTMWRMFNLKISLSLVLIRLVFGRDLRSFRCLLGCLLVLMVVVFVLSSGFTLYVFFFLFFMISSDLGFICSLIVAEKRVCTLTIVRVVMTDSSFLFFFQIIWTASGATWQVQPRRYQSLNLNLPDDVVKIQRTGNLILHLVTVLTVPNNLIIGSILNETT